MRQTLEVMWSRPLSLRSSGTTVAVSSDVLMVAERHSRLVRLDPSTGAMRWEQHVEDCWGTTVLAPGRCLYLSRRGILHCFDIGSGQPLWSQPNLQFHRYLTVSGDVVVLGGWRGYRAVTRVRLAGGTPQAFASVGAPGESLAWPVAVRLERDAAPAFDAVLLAGADRPELRVADPRAGTVVGTLPLPAPVWFSDSGKAFTDGDDGRVVFLSGTRTVMSFSPSAGVETLWQHERDLLPVAPVLVDGRLMLAEDGGTSVVDLLDGAHTELASLSVPVRIGDAALFAHDNGNLVVLDRSGVRARTRLPRRVEQLFAGGGSWAYVIGKGHLTALRLSGTGSAV